jgi:hypothetical protein
MVKHRSGTRWPDDREVGWHRVRSTPCIRRSGAHVSWLNLKTKVDGFSVWTSKPASLVLWFEPQNQVSFDLSAVPQNWQREVGTEHASRSSEGKQIGLGFPSLTSRLVEALLWVVHVTSSLMLRRDEVEDGWVDVTGCVGPSYPKISVFYVLYRRNNLIFSLLFRPRNRTVEEWSFLLLLLFWFVFSNLERVSQEFKFYSNN